jgi:uncharacterized membrane protein
MTARSRARLLVHLRAHRRLALSMALGLLLALLWPATSSIVTRALLGWNAAVWLYLGLAGWMMVHADHHSLRRAAQAQAESTGTVLAIVCTACVVSLVGVLAELSAARLPGARHAWPHVLFACVTVAGSWLLLPTVFALSYASRYHHQDNGVDTGGCGLRFPDADTDADRDADPDHRSATTSTALRPDYGDFLYVAFTIAMAAQTADVAITSSPMRRLVLLQALLSFAFNTAILALTVNLAASLF